MTDVGSHAPHDQFAPEDLLRYVRHVEWLKEDAEMGVEKLLLHDVNREQEAFVGAFGEHVLPELPD